MTTTSQPKIAKQAELNLNRSTQLRAMRFEDGALLLTVSSDAVVSVSVHVDPEDIAAFKAFVGEVIGDDCREALRLLLTQTPHSVLDGDIGKRALAALGRTR